MSAHLPLPEQESFDFDHLDVIPPHDCSEWLCQHNVCWLCDLTDPCVENAR